MHAVRCAEPAKRCTLAGVKDVGVARAAERSEGVGGVRTVAAF